MLALAVVGKQSFQRQARYGGAAMAGMFTNTVFGFLMASVLVAAAGSQGGTLRGWTTSQYTTFVFFAQASIATTGVFGDRELPDRISTGNVEVDLYRPIDFQLWWFAIWLGKVAYLVPIRSLPPLVIGAVAFDLAWPPHWWAWLVTMVAMVLGSSAGFGIRFLAGLTTFWLLDNRGVDQLVTVVMSFFGGMYLPLQLLPPWLEPIARFLPFAAMIQLPAELFLGLHSPRHAVGVVAGQILWVVVLLAAGRYVLRRATRKVVIQGG